jgi:hypothetical protein
MTTINEFDEITKYLKKDYCENTEGNPPYGKCKQSKYHHSELQIDHKDGNPHNNEQSNLWTICSNCHQRKGDYQGDSKTPGRGLLNPTPATFQKVTNKLIDTFSSDSYMKLRNDIREKYFINPLKEAYGNGKINALCGPTGFGKTFGIFVEAAPFHFNKGGRLHIFTSPFTESAPYREIHDYVHRFAKYDNPNHLPQFYHSSEKLNWTSVTDDLEKGYNVTVVMSDQYLAGKGKIDIVEKLVKKYNTLLTRDEASYGMLSTYEISNKILGHVYSSETTQTYYNNFLKLYNAGAHSYGITATPTREMTEIIGAEWNLLNTIPNTLELTPFRKWFRSLQLADWNHNDYVDDTILPNELDSLFAKINAENKRIQEFNKTYECSDISAEKVTGMIVTQTSGGARSKILIADILDYLENGKSLMSSEHTLLVVTADGWKEYDYCGNEVARGKGDEFQTKLNSSNEKAHYLVVINKAVYGVNIKTLGFGLIFRQYGNIAADTEESITLTAEQLLGRFNRINFSKEKIVYLTKKYGPYAVYEYLSIAGIGCFDIKAPNSNQFETAFSNFKENHGTHVMDAMNYLFGY